MSTPTQLQEVYDCFISKVDEDLTDKESLIFEYFKTAKSKSYKIVPHELTYIITDEITYDGNFLLTLDQDEIELIALYMLYEHRNKKESYLLGLRSFVGTKDFNSLPDKKRELDGIQNSKKLLKEEIDDLKQQFYDYKYN